MDTRLNWIAGGLGASTTNPSDADLVLSALGGDETAFASIMSRNNRRLYRVARAILRNDPDTEDAMQEAYLRAFTKLGSFNGQGSLTTWLTSIVINESLARLRRGRASRGWQLASIRRRPRTPAGDLCPPNPWIPSAR